MHKHINYLLCLLLTTASVMADESKFELGKRLYTEACITCHGGSGVPSKNLRFVVRPRDLSKTILTQEQTYKIIKYGTHYWGSCSDMMPAFRYVYTDKEIGAIAYYVYINFNKNVKNRIEKLYNQSDPIPKNKRSKMLKRGEKVYKRNCSWCHGLDARGNGEATKNPKQSIFPYDLRKTLLTNKQMFLYAKYGGHYWGTDKNDMPSWSRKYDDFTLKSVVKYIDFTFRKNKTKKANP